MKLHSPNFHFTVPDAQPLSAAWERVTHLGIGAHQDDLEIMAFHGIATCFESEREWFGGVICTDGAGSSRAGDYAGLTDAKLIDLRRHEQEAAAALGKYGALLQLGLPSQAVKQVDFSPLAHDLAEVLLLVQPEVLYTHNPADKHDTHLAVFRATLQAVRSLPPEKRPRRMLGCEVWRDLDWLADEEKVRLEIGGHGDLQQRLIACFASQTDGGKRYELAAPGRARANATFFAPRESDRSEAVWLAMDLTPLLQDDALDPSELVAGHLRAFEHEVLTRLGRAFR